MKIFFKGQNFRYDFEHVVRIFCKEVEVISEPMTKKDRTLQEDYTYFRYTTTSSFLHLLVVVYFGGVRSIKTLRIEAVATENEVKRLLGVMFYDIVSSMTNSYPAWGILTGVRPVKLVTKEIRNKQTEQEIVNKLYQDYRVGKDKAEIAYQTALASEKIEKTNTANSCSVYISIPFCPSRCNYCSFVAQSIEKQHHLLDEYQEKLLLEIETTAEIINALKLKVKSIYVGGGTPTVLNERQLELLCGELKRKFLSNDVLEYTFEAGRADTITLPKLEILKEYGVNRISINPQTFSDAVLERIGRKHTTEDVIKAFEIARKASFMNINADLIAGLPGDTIEGFSESLASLISLKPASITVHTLTLKKSSFLINSDQTLPFGASKMIDNAYQTLKFSQYYPYYIYRLKRALENLENIGYAQLGYEGLYNVYIMQELHSIFSVGASGVTKIVAGDSRRINRIFNYKYPTEYIKNFDEVLRRKERILSYYQ